MKSSTPIAAPKKLENCLDTNISRIKRPIQKVVDFIKMEGPKKFKYNYKIEIDSELVQ